MNRTIAIHYLSGDIGRTIEIPVGEHNTEPDRVLLQKLRSQIRSEGGYFATDKKFIMESQIYRIEFEE